MESVKEYSKNILTAECFRFFSDLPAKLLDLTDDQHIYTVPGKNTKEN